jgi:hypothetical protein
VVLCKNSDFAYDSSLQHFRANLDRELDSGVGHEGETFLDLLGGTAVVPFGLDESHEGIRVGQVDQKVCVAHLLHDAFSKM